MQDTDEFRLHLNEGWSSSQQMVIGQRIDQWRFWLRT